MKLFLRIALVFIGIFILTELNSNSLISDTKGLFQKTPHTSSFFSDATTLRDTDKITNIYVQLLHLKNDSCKYTDTSQMYLGHATNNSVIGATYSFIYEKQYYLRACELSDSFNISLKTLKQYNISATHCYGIIESDNVSAVDYSRRLSMDKSITGIYLKILGKNTQEILKNDSIACYYSTFTTLSVQYNSQNGPDEIYAETKSSNLFHTDLLPMEILFLKKDHKLYLITMSAYHDDNNVKYIPGMLYNLIK